MGKKISLELSPLYYCTDWRFIPFMTSKGSDAHLSIWCLHMQSFEVEKCLEQALETHICSFSIQLGSHVKRMIHVVIQIGIYPDLELAWPNRNSHLA